MLDLDVAAWGFGVLWLCSLAALYTAGFFWFYVRFTRALRRAHELGGQAIQRYNESLRGFPNGFYAKMLGRRPL